VEGSKVSVARPNATQRSFAVFPFLKTSGPVSIGNLILRSTDDPGELDDQESMHLHDIAEMLFLQDDLRIRSASYATVPYIDLNRPGHQLEHLARVHAFVAYAYGSPHELFGDPFLSTEHTSLVIFSPGPVSAFLVRPHYHVDAVGSAKEFVPDQRHEIQGYAGLYNFRHHFWASKGSRLYGPIPHLTMNISQDLVQLGPRGSRRDVNLLANTFGGPATEISDRVFTAIRWFNAANAASSDDAAAIVSLAIAFETILALPDREKVTERLTDAVALLLGRIPRLENWARQFYDTRSEIVHEGRTRQLRFIASDSRKPLPNTPQYQSLLSYGRQIFQLCVEALLSGADLAERAGLADKLITNQERFERICAILSASSLSAAEKLDRFRFFSETGLRIDSMLGAARLWATTLLASDLTLDVELRERLGRLAHTRRTADHYDGLDAVRSVHEFVCALGKALHMDEGVWASFTIVGVVWNYAFMHYFWLREQRETNAAAANVSAPGNETSEEPPSNGIRRASPVEPEPSS
jgi:hypothetical protein